MKPSERLKEIDQENRMTGGDKDITWLLNRIDKLTEALEHISKADTCNVESGPDIFFLTNWRNETKSLARKALEGDE